MSSRRPGPTLDPGPAPAHEFVEGDIARTSVRGKVLRLEDRDGLPGAVLDLGPGRPECWFALRALDWQGRCEA